MHGEIVGYSMSTIEQRIFNILSVYDSVFDSIANVLLALMMLILCNIDVSISNIFITRYDTEWINKLKIHVFGVK